MAETSNGSNGTHEQSHNFQQPEFVPSFGNRWVSLAALVEQIEAAFLESYAGNSPELAEADTPAKRLKLVLETTNYVISVESVQLSSNEKADVISRTYSNLFGYGPLDSLFADDGITTISLEGADKAAIRRGNGDLISLGQIFQSAEHYQRILNRLVSVAGAEMRPDHPYLELGLTIGERRVALNLVAPPVTVISKADIRLHPKELPNWDSLIASGFMTDDAVQLLKALIASNYGLLIIGEPESGKTTLLNLLMNELSNPEQVVSVERAGEMQLPTGMKRLTAVWPVGDSSRVSFGQQIINALEQHPACILLDEVRADEPQTIAPLLQMEQAPRQIWSFRGAIFAKRLQSALGMLARRAEVGAGEALIRPLYERLPFVIAVNRVGGQLRLWSVGEWQFKHNPDYPTYISLMHVEESQLKRTGEQPSRPLALPDDFWMRD